MFVDLPPLRQNIYNAKRRYRSSRRRNGKLASCEPCRKDKVRCNHAQPVCSRCEQRGFTRRCFYHPAPLTRSRRRDPSASAESILMVRAPSYPEQQPASGSSRLEGTALNPRLDALLPMHSQIGEYLPTGYLGPTSSITVIENGNDLDRLDQLPQGQVEIRATHGSISTSWSAHGVTELANCLQDFPTIQSLIHNYYTVNQSAVIAAPLILRALAQIETTYRDIILGSPGQVSELTSFIIKNTRQPLDIPSTTDGINFHELYTGSSLRLEIIGIIYALAGRANSFGLSYNIKNDHAGSMAPAQFSRRMLAASDLAIQICKSLSPVNDLFLWLVHENLLLSNIIQGDSSSVTWHRLGELATYMFEIGLHREPELNNFSCLPTFILESRRRLFAAAYQLDKTIGTLLGRPPRISWRYSDCRMPLDISDEALTDDVDFVNAAQNFLDGEGWNTERTFQRASWIRVRFITSTFREEILELSLQRASPERSCWDTNLPVGVKLMLIIAYLAYLYNEFLVQKLLVQGDCVAAKDSLLNVSSTILSTVLALGKQQERSVDIRCDFNWTILLYGFSSASVLVTGLQRAEVQQPIQSHRSRSALIRDLSVFISHLESMARPGQRNHILLDRAARTFARIVDEILEPQSVAEETSQLPHRNFGNENGASPFLDLDELEFLDMIDFTATLNQTMF
ncbi:hypothetical protein PVAR5_9032 [Paecilomyces variotii No. 5]|uniref:Zn(2)-C6 fungal-type domain-containing protein n=1 Tax=Byssochlamys spectabilis (strain No. 5 / NBRC 109023) TaxID=1356009 RepID=V5I687_BYSSN|nr:hypothetical protein PVAR5_9032 [Paecilomyces variotii No. 5]